MAVSIRPIDPADGPELARLHAANRAFMAPWDAVRDESFFTAAGQHADIERYVAAAAAGTALRHAILQRDDLVGVITLNGIVRGPFLSCSLGYWVAESANGQGVATTAVSRMLEVAFGEQGLHRVQAETLLDNVRSQRVLEKNGFERIGMAPKFLRIAGEWRDHLLFQRLAPTAVHRA